MSARSLILVSGLFILQSGIGSAIADVTVSEPEEKQIVVYEELSFTEQSYQPPVEMPSLDDYKKFPLVAPEDVLFARYAAFLRSDMEWASHLLVESDRKMMEDQSAAEREKRNETLKKQVEFLLRGSKVILKKKIVSGNFTIIDYAIVKAGKEVLYLFAVFVQEDDSWKICRTCGLSSGHPIHPLIVNMNYRFPGREKKIANVKLNSIKPHDRKIKIKK